MKCIDKNNIAFKELKLLNPNNPNIYLKDNTVYKFFRWDDYDVHIKEGVMESLNHKKEISNAVFPNAKIKAGSETLGCTTELQMDTTPLDEYRTISNDFNSYITLTKDVSSTLKNIHQNDCVVTNFTFQNILFKSSLEHCFISTDSWTVGYNYSSYVSNILYTFLKAQEIKLYFNKAYPNIDKLSFILSFLEVIFNMPIQKVSRHDYEEVIEKMKLSRETLILFRNILDRNPLKIDLPYVGDCISNNQENCFYTKK